MRMTKTELLQQLTDFIPDGATVEYATATILTRDFQTLNYDTDMELTKNCNNCNGGCKGFASPCSLWEPKESQDT